MKQCMAFALIVGFLVAADDPKKDKAKDDKEKIQGTWAVISVERGGEKGPAERIKDLKFVFKGDGCTISSPDQKERGSTFKLDPTKKPKTIDLTVAEGSTKGQTVAGIYSLEGDELKICAGEPGAERPTAFASKPGEKLTLLVLKREKP